MNLLIWWIVRAADRHRSEGSFLRCDKVRALKTYTLWLKPLSQAITQLL
ncbi:hypothetical protein J2X66_005036 [Pseudomonas sp. 3296]|mgnify:CR=1 FL=1|nr:hypothetical protein [Pseudomonas sp. 3296]